MTQTHAAFWILLVVEDPNYVELRHGPDFIGVNIIMVWKVLRCNSQMDGKPRRHSVRIVTYYHSYHSIMKLWHDIGPPSFSNQKAAKIITLIPLFLGENRWISQDFNIPIPPRVESWDSWNLSQGLLSHLVNGAALAQLTTALWSLQVGAIVITVAYRIHLHVGSPYDLPQCIWPASAGSPWTHHV